MRAAKPLAHSCNSVVGNKVAAAVPAKLFKSVARGRRNISCQAAGAAATERAAPATEWLQKTVSLPSMNRGCHIITRHIVREVQELQGFEVGMANLFIQHTSASLTINENASPDVPLDLNDTLDRIVPEGHHYRHLDEGLDDMPAHVKSSLMGPSLNIPIQQGRLALGTWQGIYLNEHRNYGGSRKIVVTLQGKLRPDGRKYGSNAW
ncbi:g7491 [Coccomyxa viridis]|uniref:G7491 protein n=1 Tax=Coccomyxa viridis TaxID=1274662 RepID=A0ABP1FXZ5_9CHLO